MLQSALIEREKDAEEKNAQRIEEIKIKKTEQKNRLIAKIQRRKIKVLRKLIKRRKEIDDDKRKREIIEEYANFGSKVNKNLWMYLIFMEGLCRNNQRRLIIG